MQSIRRRIDGGRAEERPGRELREVKIDGKESDMDQWYIDNLVCPIDKSRLEYSNGTLISGAGRKYPTVEGIPVMLVDDIEQTMWVASASLRRAKGEDIGDQRANDLHLESLGISAAEKEAVLQLAQQRNLSVDPVVAFLIGATSGYAYKHLMGNLKGYPIPELRLPAARGKSFLDLGCNWGRWCVAAAKKGYSPVGIDPSLGAIMAARRVALQLGLQIKYLVADARFLPFKEASFDTVFSYSVLQHLSKDNVQLVVSEVSRILNPGGTSLIQMPNRLGIRCLQHQIRRGFREARDFEVRYWSLQELKNIFSSGIGQTTISVDCYFGLGLQKADIGLMPPKLRFVINISELLRGMSEKYGFLKHAADSVYVKSIRSNGISRSADQLGGKSAAIASHAK